MLFEVGAAISVGKVIYNMYQSDKMDEMALNKSLKSMNRMEEAKAAQRVKREDAKQSMLRLGNRKKGILGSSMKRFIEVYEQIKEINFIEKDGSMELKYLPAVWESEIISQVSYASAPMTDGEIVTSMVVNGFFWGIGGGVSALIKKDSERNLEMAQARAKQARIIAEQANTVSLAYEAIIERSNQITDVLTKLNLLFVKSLANTENIISERGADKTKYSFSDRENLAVCINLASAVKKIIDTPLLDETGEIAAKSLEAIRIGQEYIQKINCEINK